MLYHEAKKEAIAIHEKFMNTQNGCVRNCTIQGANLFV